MKGTGLRNGELARLLDVSAALVTKYVAEGMPTESGAAARRWITANKRARVKNGTKRAAPNPYMHSRVARERAEAELAQLRVLEARRDLVNGAKVREELASRLAGLRNSLLQIPSRLQSVLAAEQDEARCHDLVQDEIYLVLAQFAEAL